MLNKDLGIRMREGVRTRTWGLSLRKRLRKKVRGMTIMRRLGQSIVLSVFETRMIFPEIWISL